MNRVQSNPWQGVRVPRPPEAPEVTVLSPKDAARLLRSCRPSPAVWRYALAGLALGLRPSEAARVTRASLRDGHLEVAGRKTNQTRFLSLDAGLWRAFTAGKGQHPGDLPAGVLRRLWREARDRAAVTVPPDALRHSFASYWLPIHADRPRLAELMGNSPEIIARHYRRPVPAAVARRYWQAINQEIRHAR